MEMSSRKINDVFVVDISGEVDLYNASKIKNDIGEQIDNGTTKIIINLKQVNYIDSSGIGALIYCRSALKKKKGSLIILNICDSVKKIFELTKLTSVFTILYDEKQAIQQLQEK